MAKVMEKEAPPSSVSFEWLLLLLFLETEYAVSDEEEGSTVSSGLDLKSVSIPPSDWLCCAVGEVMSSLLDSALKLVAPSEEGGSDFELSAIVSIASTSKFSLFYWVEGH